MHRDFTLGIALAVLLIGSTAAFFFRAPADPAEGLPQLQDPERLDGEIARRDVTPYLGADRGRPAAGRETSSSPWAKPAFLAHATSGAASRLTPDPIQLSMEEEMGSSDAGVSLSGDGPAPNGLPPAGLPGTHVVRAGDTLTGLAAKYLGSLARYREIFELNRDQLEAPDDLRIGMTLKLPQASAIGAQPEFRPAAATRHLENSAIIRAKPSSDRTDGTLPGTADDVTDSSPSSPGEEVESGMFVPARKAPFVPGRYRSQPALRGNEIDDTSGA